MSGPSIAWTPPESDLRGLLIELLHSEHQWLAQQLREQHEALLGQLRGCLHAMHGYNADHPTCTLVAPCTPHCHTMEEEDKHHDFNLPKSAGSKSEKNNKLSCASMNCGPPLIETCNAGTPCVPEKDLPPDSLEYFAEIKHDPADSTPTEAYSSKSRIWHILNDDDYEAEDEDDSNDDNDSDWCGDTGVGGGSGGRSVPHDSGTDTQELRVKRMRSTSSSRKHMSRSQTFDYSAFPLQPEPPTHTNQFWERVLLLRWRMQHIACSPRFEITFASFILLNTVVMASWMQYEGAGIGWKVQHPSAVYFQSSGVEGFFYYSELLFGFLFFFELSFSIIAFGIRFCLTSVWFLLDCLTVLVWFMDFFRLFNVGVNPMIVRLVRLARLLKMLRLVKTVQAFDTLHLLVFSIRSGIATLLWSACVLLLVKMCVAMVLSQLLQGFILDSRNKEEIRHQVWARFGTFIRTMLTMFEITLANWVPPCRLLMDHISVWYALFFMFYKLSVGFAVVNVINAVFIQQTMKVAATDENIVVMQKEQQAQKYKARLKRVFSQLDRSGNGFFTFKEFQEAMSNKRVKALISALEVEVREALALFKLLDHGDGEVSWDDFVYGMQRLRGNAQSVDVMTLLCLQRKEGRQIAKMHKELLAVVRELHGFRIWHRPYGCK